MLRTLSEIQRAGEVIAEMRRQYERATQLPGYSVVAHTTLNSLASAFDWLEGKSGVFDSYIANASENVAGLRDALDERDALMELAKLID